MKERAKFIFVGGCGRSGTTLIQKLLTSHSKISGSEEFGFTKEIFSTYKDMKSKYEEGFLGSYIENETALKRIFKDFYKSFFPYDQNDNSYISEKTPNNIDVLKEILEIFENAIFLNVVRDGRDVISSHLAVKKRYKRAGRFAGFGLISVCKLWNTSIEEYLKFVAEPRVFNIRFEELILDPVSSLSQIFNRLELNVETEQLSPQNIENENRAHINDIWYTQEMFGKGFDKTSIGKWKKLGPIKKFVINIAMAKNLNELNYKVSKFYVGAQSFLAYFDISRSRNSLIHKFYIKLRLLFS